ncbi:hypothetical protein [Aliidiomarina sanyensis]|uniref:Lysozyme inhibitor LprI N-terminal domain-containing protein n=1 Tax=Aliidiomarina sanyensis TaxID=1249555 RepID=A0A432WS56_9GAMM|nr:hypothetical protein [Aliidiomarina sanyensis]RUO36578.1 hypothetical protein CWE11_01835 [Aliidiomarina sanyensis]
MRRFILLSAVCGFSIALPFSLTGCDATEAANFSLASECYNRHPNDMWARQQCVDRGIYQREATACQHDVNGLRATYGGNRIENLHLQADRQIQIAWQWVEPYSDNFNQCLASNTYSVCYNNLTAPSLNHIAAAREQALRVAAEENGYAQRWNSILNRCSQYMNQQIPYKDHYNNADLIAELDSWTLFVNNSTNYWRQVHQK